MDEYLKEIIAYANSTFDCAIQLNRDIKNLLIWQEHVADSIKLLIFTNLGVEKIHLEAWYISRFTPFWNMEMRVNISTTMPLMFAQTAARKAMKSSNKWKGLGQEDNKPRKAMMGKGWKYYKSGHLVTAIGNRDFWGRAQWKQGSLPKEHTLYFAWTWQSILKWIKQQSCNLLMYLSRSEVWFNRLLKPAFTLTLLVNENSAGSGSDKGGAGALNVLIAIG
ncbi:hypothetical protein BD769DRAFT_1396653 [Suillus cothurnatus]|nr:hypothetical protein BD769DRAFT_1396653 [Suillus cothurnatus]